VFIIAQRHHRRLAKIRAYLARELVDVVREDVSQRKSASHHFFLCVLCVLFLLGTRARAHLTKRGTFFFSSIIDAHHVAKKRQKRQNWLSKAMKNVIERLARGRKKKQRLVAPEKKKETAARESKKKREVRRTRAHPELFFARRTTRRTLYRGERSRFRAFASSSEGRRSFFLFYFKNARLVFFLSLSLFLRGENGEKKYKRALVPSPPGANAKMFGEKRLAFRAEWTRVNAVWCSRREVFFRAMY